MLIGCQQTGNQKTNISQEAAEAEVSIQDAQAYSLTAQDSAFLNSLIKDLNGIDKFFVKNSYKRLQVILEKKDNQNTPKVHEILENVSTNEPDYYIEKYMPKNGYLAYTPGPVEVFIDMVYWNVSDGSQLIATQLTAMGDQPSISFEKHTSGTFKKVESLIPDVATLSDKLVPGYSPDNSEEEFVFKLPIEGKDLRFCVDGSEDNCLILEWNDGTFVLKE